MDRREFIKPDCLGWHKDTLIIEPHKGSGAIEFMADNPGDWFHHCHNLYHKIGGMANVVRYE